MEILIDSNSGLNISLTRHEAKLCGKFIAAHPGCSVKKVLKQFKNDEKKIYFRQYEKAIKEVMRNAELGGHLVHQDSPIVVEFKAKLKLQFLEAVICALVVD